MNYSLDPLFKPRAVALIGASAKELSIGNVIIKNLLHYKFNGPLYPINPKVDEIRGLKAYRSILDLPGEVDLAHIVIPPPFVPDEVENCGKKISVLYSRPQFTRKMSMGRTVNRPGKTRSHENG